MIPCPKKDSGHPEFDTKLMDDCPICFPRITIRKWECNEFGCGKYNKPGLTYCSNVHCNGKAE